MRILRASLIMVMLHFIALSLYAETNARVWGDITAISQNEFVIGHGAVSDGSYIKISIETTTDTIFEGVKSLKDLTSGDFVIVEYHPSSSEGLGAAIKVTAAGKLETQRQRSLNSRDTATEIRLLKEDVKRIKEKLGMD